MRAIWDGRNRSRCWRSSSRQRFPTEGTWRGMRSRSTFVSSRDHDWKGGQSVNVKCFGCDALIEADDADAVVDAFVAHARESHTWSYPEDAIRNYARNYAEATERLTGGTERLPEIADIT